MIAQSYADGERKPSLGKVEEIHSLIDRCFVQEARQESNLMGLSMSFIFRVDFNI